MPEPPQALRKLGHYELIAQIGAGGMGEVYRARDPRLGRDVAVKVLPPEFVANPQRRARFERESKILAGLSHPNIVVVHDVGDSYLVQELIIGETLGRRPKASARKVADLGAQIANGLAAAHRAGITHRDLKPDNVMVTPDGLMRSARPATQMPGDRSAGLGTGPGACRATRPQPSARGRSPGS